MKKQNNIFNRKLSDNEYFYFKNERNADPKLKLVLELKKDTFDISKANCALKKISKIHPIFQLEIQKRRYVQRIKDIKIIVVDNEYEIDENDISYFENLSEYYNDRYINILFVKNPRKDYLIFVYIIH